MLVLNWKPNDAFAWALHQVFSDLIEAVREPFELPQLVVHLRHGGVEPLPGDLVYSEVPRKSCLLLRGVWTGGSLGTG